MGLLSNVPLGFSEAVSMLNALPQSLLAEIVIVLTVYLCISFSNSFSVKMSWHSCNTMLALSMSSNINWLV